MNPDVSSYRVPDLTLRMKYMYTAEDEKNNKNKKKTKKKTTTKNKKTNKQTKNNNNNNKQLDVPKHEVNVIQSIL